MRASEWIVLAYLLYLSVAALARRLPGRRRGIILSASSGIALLILLLASLPSTLAVDVARDWLPGLYLLAGFWLSGLFNTGAHTGLEAWLEQTDRALVPRLPFAGGRRPPRAMSELLEAAYLCCYAVVPAGIAVLYLTGHRGQADAYWAAVLAAAYVSYGTLVFFVTRPPRSIERQDDRGRADGGLRRLNLAVLWHASIQVNTLPSGHAAVAFASAIALGRPLPAAGAAFGAIACAISAGAVAGRYHYAVDVVLGAIVGVVAGLAVRP